MEKAKVYYSDLRTSPTALARRPEYSVLQSVKKGLAPRLRSRVAIRAA